MGSADKLHRQYDETAHFLNVAFEIYSKSDLAPLVAALGKRVDVLFQGRTRRTWEARLEVASYARNVDTTIRKFAALIDKLPKKARNLWETATTRDFAIGVQAAMQPSAWDLALSLETVEIASRLKARIVFVVYSPALLKTTVKKPAEKQL